MREFKELHTMGVVNVRREDRFGFLRKVLLEDSFAGFIEVPSRGAVSLPQCPDERIIAVHTGRFSSPKYAISSDVDVDLQILLFNPLGALRQGQQFYLITTIPPSEFDEKLLRDIRVSYVPFFLVAPALAAIMWLLSRGETGLATYVTSVAAALLVAAAVTSIGRATVRVSRRLDAKFGRRVI